MFGCYSATTLSTNQTDTEINQTKPSITKPTAHSTTLKITTEKVIETEDTTKISTTNPTKISNSKSTLGSKSEEAKGRNSHKNHKIEMKAVFSEKCLICYRSHRFVFSFIYSHWSDCIVFYINCYYGYHFIVDPKEKVSSKYAETKR